MLLSRPRFRCTQCRTADTRKPPTYPVQMDISLRPCHEHGNGQFEATTGSSMPEICSVSRKGSGIQFQVLFGQSRPGPRPGPGPGVKGARAGQTGSVECRPAAMAPRLRPCPCVYDADCAHEQDRNSECGMPDAGNTGFRIEDPTEYGWEENG